MAPRALLLAPFVAAAVLAACGGDVTARLAEARRLRDDGKPRDAAEIFAGLSRRRPDDTELLSEYATVLHEAGRDHEALARVEELIARRPAEAGARVLHGTILGALGREEEALAELQKVATAEPRRAGVHRAMAFILARSGRVGAAVNQFEKELGLNPDDQTTLTELGVFYFTTNQIEQAEDRLRRAAAGPGNARAHRYLAEVYFRQMKTEAGLEEQRRALELAPDDVDLLVSHARALAGYGHAEESRALLKNATERGLRDASVAVEMGRQARDVLDYDAAVTYFKEALVIDPMLADAQMNLGKTYLFQGRTVEARAAFEAARNLAPADAYVHFYLGTLLADEKKYDESIPLFQRSLEFDPYNPKAHYALGQSLLRVGRLGEARAEFARHGEILKRLREAKQSGTATAE